MPVRSSVEGGAAGASGLDVALLRGVARGMASGCVAATDVEQIDQIRALEDVKAACAAAQARVTAQFAAQRRRAAVAHDGDELRACARSGSSQGRDLPGDSQAARRANARLVRGKAERLAARSAASEVALARRESPQRGGRFVGLAEVLVHEMPHTFEALAAGTINEWRATLIVRETACLSREHRGQVDVEIAADRSRLEGVGDSRLVAQVKKAAYRLEPRAATERAVKAAADRRVTLRPAPDCMAYLTQLLPITAATACYAALQRAADAAPAAGEDRTRAQRMADEAMNRLLGPARVGNEDRDRDPVPGPGGDHRDHGRDSDAGDLAGSDISPDPAGGVAAEPHDDPVEAVRRAYAIAKQRDQNPSRQHVGGKGTRLGEPDPPPTRGSPTRGSPPGGSSPGELSGNGPPPVATSPSGSPPDRLIPASGPDRPPTRAPAASHESGPPLDAACPRPDGSCPHQDAACPCPDGSCPHQDAACPPAAADAVPPGVGVVLNMTITDRALLADGDEPAVLGGNIPMPAPLARRIIAGMPDDASVWLRRLYCRPDTGELVTMESRQRTFSPAMRRLLFARDADTCRTPWCNAPARHADHITPAAADGPTAIANGQALSEDCNYIRSASGWGGCRDGDGRIVVTAPTGHRYASPPTAHHHVRPVEICSRLEGKLAICLAQAG